MAPRPDDSARRGRLRAEYAARMNRVLDHVEAHLFEPLPLEELARVACFSPYHFHRVFRAWTGEPFGRFVQRLRLERAATWLTLSPERPVTDIALDAGFSGSDTFARAFRARFGTTPTAWRDGGADGAGEDSKIGMAVRNGCQAARVEATYDLSRTPPTRWRIEMATNDGTLKAEVEVTEQPVRTVAYLRHIGPYQGDGALFGRLFGQLFGWAGPRGLLGPQTEVMSIYHDDPGVTDDDKLRLTVGITVAPDAEVEAPIGKLTLDGGAVAVARFTVSDAEYGAAWQAVMGGWLPESGYEPDDRPCYEVYPSDAEAPEGKRTVLICVPVRPL